MKRRDSVEWFNEPVPPDTDGYAEAVPNPMDYGTVLGKLKLSGYYGSGGAFSSSAFAADVRLVTANAVAYSPETDNECHKAARASLVAFEKAYLKAGLASDAGEALKAAETALKTPPSTATRKRARGDA